MLIARLKAAGPGDRDKDLLETKENMEWETVRSVWDRILDFPLIDVNRLVNLGRSAVTKPAFAQRVGYEEVTLSHTNQSRALFQHFLSSLTGPNLQDEATFADCERAAQQGAPIAQVALAQMHGTRRANPRDLMQACMWYLIASEKISQAGKSVSESLSTEELLQAELMAADWLGKSREIQPPRMKSATVRAPRTNAGASSA